MALASLAGPWTAIVSGQTPAPVAAPAPAAAETAKPASSPAMSADIARYHTMLLRRPQAGVVFDRFYDAWLGTGTVEGLTEFLQKRASSPNATAADHLVLALSFSRRGDDTSALKAYERALELEPNNAFAWSERARLETRMLNIDAALKSLERGIAAKPDATLLLDLSKQRARHLLRLGKNEEALKAFREMVAAQPNDEDLAEEVVYIQMEEGLPDEAAKGMEALISKTKDAYQKVTRLLLLGEIRQKLGNRDEAVNAYEDALDLAGKDTWVEGEVLSRIEQTYRREDDLEGLATKLGTLGAADPARVRLGQQHAQALSDLGKGEEAIKVYQDLLSRTPGRQSVREGYLGLLESAGKLTEAIEQAKALRAQLSGDKEWIIRLAALQHRAKEDTAAQATLKEYLAVPGTGESDRLRVARLLETWDLKDAAKIAYEELVKAHAESVSAREAQAQFLHRIEERDAALAIWRDIAAKGSLEEAIQVGQALGARMEYSVALEVLAARISTSPREPRLLAALCTAAAGAKEYAKAVPWARERVQMAREVSEVEESVKAASMVIRNAGAAEATAKEIAALPSPTAAERCLLADLRESMKDHAGADAALAALTGPDEALGLQQQVRLLQARLEWVRAAQAMAKLIALPEGRNSSNVQKLVDLHQRAGQANDALTWIAEWKKLSPGAVTPWTTEARLLSDSGRTDDSIKVLREAYRKFSDNPDIAATFGDQLVAAGKTEEAMQIFEAWYEKTEEVTGKLRWAGSLARAAVAGGNTNQLVERFRERQKKNRKSIVPWMALAEIHRATGNAEGRRTAIMEAANLRPQDLDLLLELARLQEEDGLWKEALVTLETARPLDKSTKVRERQAGIQLRYGDENLGYRILFELAGGDQMDARGIERMADGIAARGEWERVTEFLGPLLTKFPKDYRLQFLQAVAMEESGRDKEAITAFIQLMQPMEELPGVVVPEGGVMGMNRNPYQEQMLNSLPPGLPGFLELTQTWQLAYRHRQSRGNGFTSFNYPGMPASTGFVAVPPYALSTPSFSAVHLISLAQGLKDDEREELATRLKRQDMSQAEMFVHLQWDPQRGGVVVEDEWLLKNPEDDAALAWWVLNTMSRGSLTRTAQQSDALLRKAFDRFRPRYPGLAVQASFAARDTGTEEGKALFAEGVKMVTTMDKVDFVTTQALFTQLQQRRGGSEMMSLPAEEEEVLLQALKKQLQLTDTKTDPYKGWMTMSLGRMLTERGKWDDAMEFAQADQDRYEQAEPGRRNSLTPQFFVGAGSTNMVNPLPFPAEINGISNTALTVAIPNLSNTLFSPGSEEPNLTEVPRNEPLIKASAKLKNDLLRHVALLAGGDRDSFTKFLDAKLQAEPDKPGPVLLMAWAAQQAQDYPKAVQWLQKALALTMDAQDRLSVENALLHNAAASQASKDGKPDPAMTAELLDYSKELAKRMARNTSLTIGQKQYLARAMDTLAMTQEAEQLRATPKSAGGGRSSPNPFNPSPSAPNTVEQLAGKNQREAAAREAAKQLRLIVPELFTTNSEYAASRAEELLKIIEKRELTADVLKAADPGDSASQRRKLEYAGLHELLGKEKEALQLYEQLLVAAPRTTEAQVRVISILTSTDPAAAAKRISELKSAPTTATVLQNLVQVMQNSSARGGLSRRIAATRTLTKTLEQMATTDSRLPSEIPLSYLAMGPRCIGQAHYGNGSDSSQQDPRLPDIYSASLYDGTHQDKDELAGEKSAKGKERRAAHDALCLAMMKLPEFASDGFSALACIALAEKQDLATIKTQATECLRLMADPAKRRRAEMARAYNSFGYNSGGSDRLWQPTPTEFLIYAAWRDNAPERLEKEIYPLIATDGDKETAVVRSAKAFAKLWFGKPEEFTQAADDWAKTDKQNGMGQPAWSWFADGGYMENLLRFALERKIENQIDDWVIGKIKDAFRDNVHVDMECLHTWLRLQATHGGGGGKVIAFVEKLGDTLFGGEEGRRKAGKDFVAQRYGGSNTQNARAYSYGQFIESLMEEGGVPGAGLRIMVHENWPELPAAAQQIRYRLDDEDVYRDVTSLALLLEGAPFGGEVAEFRAYGTKDRQATTIMGGVLAELRKRDKVRAEVLQQLKKTDKPTFGQALSIASLEEKHDVALMEFITVRKDDMAKLGTPAQDELRDVLKQVWPALLRPENMPQERQEILRPLFAAEMKSAAERRAMVLSANNLEELKMEDRPFFDFLRNEVTRLVVENKDDEAIALFDKGCTLVEKKMTTRGWDDGQNSNGWTPRSHLADQILDARNGWDLLRFGVRLYNSDTSGKLEHPGHPNSNEWNRTLLEYWKREGGYWRPESALNTTLGLMNSTIKGQETYILMPVLSEVASHVPARLRAQVVKWAEETGSKKPYAKLARQYAVALRFYNFINPGKKVEKDADGKRLPDPAAPSMRPEDWEYLRAMVQDNSLNPRVRLAVANWVCHYGREEVDPVLVQATMKLSAEALRNSWAHSSYHLASALRCFNQLPVDEEWKSQARETWDAWVLRNARNQETSRMGRAYDPSDTAVFAMWEMAVKARERSWQTRLRADFARTLNDSYISFVGLVRQEDFQGATDFLKAQWRDLTQWVPYFDTLDTTSTDSPQAEGVARAVNSVVAEKFVSASQDPALAELGRIFMNVGNDASQGYRDRFDGPPDYSARRNLAAEAFHPEVIKDDMMMSRAAGWMFGASVAQEKLQPIVASLAAKVNVPSLGSVSDSQVMRWNILMPLMDSHNRAMKGDFKPFDTFSDSVRNHDNWSEWLRENITEYSGRMALTRTRAFWKSQPPEKASTLMPLTDTILKDLDGRNVGDAIGMRTAMYLYDGDLEGLAKWRASLTKDQQAKYLGIYRTQSSLFTSLSALCGKDAQVRLPLERRLALIEAAVKDEWTQKNAQTNPSASFKMTILIGRLNLLSRAEIVEHGMKIAALIPREGRSFNEMADWLEEEGKAEETLAALDAVITEVNNNPSLKAPAILRKAEVLDNLGRTEDAMKVLAELDKSKLPSAILRYQWDRLDRHGKDAAKKEAAKLEAAKKEAAKKQEPKPEAAKPEEAKQEAPPQETPTPKP